MSSSLTVRPARVEDVAQMARMNVRCWQETYRGLMSDAVLDDPGFPAARERLPKRRPRYLLADRADDHRAYWRQLAAPDHARRGVGHSSGLGRYH